MLAQAAALDPPAVERVYQAGVAARRSGRSAEAIADFESIEASRSGDADFWLNLGLADYAAGRLEPARKALDRALLLAPDYVDAQVAAARVALAQGRRARAAELLAQVRRTRPRDDAEVRALDVGVATPAASGPQRWRADAVVGYSHLSRDRAPWREYDLSLSLRAAPHTTVSGSVERSLRLGRDDTFVSGRVDHEFSRFGSAYAVLGGAPGAAFRPRVSALVGGETQPILATSDRRWLLQAGAAAGWADYPTSSVGSLTPYVTATAPHGVSLTAQLIASRLGTGEVLAGYHLRADWLAARRWRLSAGWYDAPESDTGVTTEVRAAVASVSCDVTSSLAVTLSGTEEWRKAYTRDEVALALTRRF